MAFDSTIGGEDANSYVTVAFADDYFTTRINSAWWTALGDPEKQAYLVTSTLALETWYTWRGDKVDEDQALHFPADGEDCQGNDFPTDDIPLNVKYAVCEQASFYNGIDATETPVATLQGLSEAQVGSLKAKFEKMNTPGRVGETAGGMLLCYGSKNSGASGGFESGSARLIRM